MGVFADIGRSTMQTSIGGALEGITEARKAKLDQQRLASQEARQVEMHGLNVKTAQMQQESAAYDLAKQREEEIRLKSTLPIEVAFKESYDNPEMMDFLGLVAKTSGIKWDPKGTTTVGDKERIKKQIADDPAQAFDFATIKANSAQKNYQKFKSANPKDLGMKPEEFQAAAKQAEEMYVRAVQAKDALGKNKRKADFMKDLSPDARTWMRMTGRLANFDPDDYDAEEIWNAYTDYKRQQEYQKVAMENAGRAPNTLGVTTWTTPKDGIVHVPYGTMPPKGSVPYHQSKEIDSIPPNLLQLSNTELLGMGYSQLEIQNARGSDGGPPQSPTESQNTEPDSLDNVVEDTRQFKYKGLFQ